MYTDDNDDDDDDDNNNNNNNNNNNVDYIKCIYKQEPMKCVAH